jgi:hypothetical protein
MTRFDFELACKMRVIWLEPLLLCAVSDHRAPAPPHSSAPVRQERDCFLTVRLLMFHHTSALRAFACNYSLRLLAPSTSYFSLGNSVANDRNDNIRAHALFSFCAALPMLSYLHSISSWRSISLNKAIYTRSASWSTKLHCVDELCRRSRWNIIPWFRRFSSSRACCQWSRRSQHL